MATPADNASGPLAGVRVIDMATVVMGPYAAQILGDLGADVIKIESPKDTARLGAVHRTPGMTPLAMNVNRNKRSVALDLKDSRDSQRAKDLIGSADIVITNMRINALRRLGMDYDSLAADNPHLIYAHAQGFRPDSDRADLAAYDETVQAASGLLDLAQRAGDIGEPVVLPSIFGDKVAALTIAYSALAALVHQRATGRGQLVEVPMTDTMLAFNLVEHLQGRIYEPPETDTGFPLSMTTGHRARPTADGHAMIMPYSPKNFRDLFTAAGRPDLAADPRGLGVVNPGEAARGGQQHPFLAAGPLHGRLVRVGVEDRAHAGHVGGQPAPGVHYRLAEVPGLFDELALDGSGEPRVPAHLQGAEELGRSVEGLLGTKGVPRQNSVAPVLGDVHHRT